MLAGCRSVVRDRKPGVRYFFHRKHPFRVSNHNDSPGRAMAPAPITDLHVLKTVAAAEHPSSLGAAVSRVAAASRLIFRPGATPRGERRSSVELKACVFGQNETAMAKMSFIGVLRFVSLGHTKTCQPFKQQPTFLRLAAISPLCLALNSPAPGVAYFEVPSTKK